MYRLLSIAHIPLHKCAPVKIGAQSTDDVRSYKSLTTLFMSPVSQKVKKTHKLTVIYKLLVMEL